MATIQLTLQADPPPNIDARNSAGVSVRELTESALQADEKGWVAAAAIYSV